MTNPTVIDMLRRDQQKKGSVVSVPNSQSRFGFVFSTKERIEFTRAALAALDCEGGYDLLWLDGSESPEARRLPSTYQLRNAHLAEVCLDVRGDSLGSVFAFGSDVSSQERVIYFGLRRLLELGYDYCGLIENDVILAPGWFSALIDLFHHAAGEGLAVGAASVRNYASRVLDYRECYTINWNLGAGMILFTRRAAQLVLENFAVLPTTTRKLARFYAEICRVDLRGGWDLWLDRMDRRLSRDWGFDMLLYCHGQASVGSIPGFAKDLEFDIHDRRTFYVRATQSGSGLNHNRVTRFTLAWIRFSERLCSFAWTLLQRSPWLTGWVTSLNRKKQEPLREKDESLAVEVHR